MTPSSPAYDWANTRGALWRDQLDGMEAMLAPVDVPLIAALAIPVSLIGTFAVMQAFGLSINLITLFALVLAIGERCL